ncbi:STAS domain-containing protein [Streptomyces sp. NPDC050844]|uniref:STAS domain-containing protein n=1 Tax=Streptomyces sp. NPDC050844 TaxID=3155790 RepID=UPI0033F7E950
MALTGDLDVASAKNVRDALHSALNDGTGDLVLNLSGLTSWDATGLGVIMGAHRRAGRLGRRLVLQDVPRDLERLLVATRLNRVLQMESSVTEGDGSPHPALGLCEDTAGRYR